MKVCDAAIVSGVHENADGTFTYTSTRTIAAKKLSPRTFVPLLVHCAIFYELDEDETSGLLRAYGVIRDANGAECGEGPWKMTNPFTDHGRQASDITFVLSKREPGNYELVVKVFDASVPDGDIVGDISLAFQVVQVDN